MPSNHYRQRLRRRERNVGLALMAGAGLLLVLIVALAVRAGRPGAAPAPTGPDVAAQPPASAEVFAAANLATPTSAPTSPPTPGPRLPVLSRVNVDGMQVAITVDDCFQLDNVNEIAQIAMDNGANLTFFPVGRPLKRDPDTWQRLHELGFQIECHTYRHLNLLKLGEEQIRWELESSNRQINEALGMQYTYHFLRTPGGSARDDPRVHAIMADLGGYRFMAHWRRSGTEMSGMKMANTILPGDIVLYHSTDKDLAKLRDLIPMAVQQGFQLVTLNELLGLPPNETAPLDEAAK